MQRQMPDDSLMPQVVILAGGLGTRLGEMTEKIPKSLIEVSGKPIISHILDWVKQQGCDKVLILTGHLGEMFEHFEYEGLSIDFLQEPEQMGTGGALSNAIRLLDDEFILLWGDDLHPIDYSQLLQTHRQGSLLTMTVTQEHEIMNLLHRGGYVVDYDKTTKNNNFNGYEAGTSIVSKEVVEKFMKNGKWSWEQTVYPAMSGKIRAHIDNTKFWDMGTPERLKKLEDFLDSRSI